MATKSNSGTTRSSSTATKPRQPVAAKSSATANKPKQANASKSGETAAKPKLPVAPKSSATAAKPKPPAAPKLDKPVQSAPAAIANPVLPKQILAKARQCRSEGHLREATRLYHELVENHLGTAEAETAKEMLLELEAEGDCDELLERLLAMAQHCRNEGNLNQAMEMYWELAEDHPGTAEAKKAKSILLDMAANYERDDTPHMARSIYERLLANAEG